MRITVVTPSYNQRRYLEETMRSVLGQGYPDLEYIVVDGGSTDGSIDAIKKFEDRLALWMVEPDSGQAGAINQGFEKATGDVLCWLNSDDMYLPGTLEYVAGRLDGDKTDLVFGNCVHIVEGTGHAYGTDVVDWHAAGDLLLWDYIIQPSAFWTRETWERVGPLNESMRFAFDWEWFIRAWKEGVRFAPQDRALSIYRMHEEQKTSAGADDRRREVAEVYRQYAGARYERLFLASSERVRQLRLARRWIRRLRLSRAEVPLLKVLFPMFAGYGPEAIRQIPRMIYPSP